VWGYINAFVSWSFVPSQFFSVERAAILPQITADEEPLRRSTGASQRP
jgi:hypothetical protein